jgi:Zn-dependent protease
MTSTAAADVSCPGCGTALAPAWLSCPGCHALVHAAALKELATRAAAAAEGDVQTALTAWRQSLELLPQHSRQYAWVADQIAALSQRADEAAAAAPVTSTARWKWLAPLGPVGALAWKLKFVLVAILTKGKLLLLGLTKMSTFASMALSVGVYWTAWGLWFALGVVLSIYVHEMGHVAALKRYGIPASAPMFIPGLGAFVRLNTNRIGAREDARVGLAGPLWGTGAAIAALAAASIGGGLWAAIARTGAWINLFNLMPIWQLDGGRAFGSLSRAQRWMAVAAVAVAWFITGDGVVMLVLLVAAARALAPGAAPHKDSGALALYVCITLALAVVFRASGVVNGEK